MDDEHAQRKYTAASLLDWAETLLFNSRRMQDYPPFNWAEQVKAWREAKNALPPACDHSAYLALPEPRPRHCPTCGTCMWDAGD